MAAEKGPVQPHMLPGHPPSPRTRAHTHLCALQVKSHRALSDVTRVLDSSVHSKGTDWSHVKVTSLGGNRLVGVVFWWLCFIVKIDVFVSESCRNRDAESSSIHWFTLPEDCSGLD